MIPIDRIALVCPFKQKGYANAHEHARGLQNVARADSDRAGRHHARHPTEEERCAAARLVPDLLAHIQSLFRRHAVAKSVLVFR